MVPGATPVRVVLDSTLRTPPNARVFADDAPTIVFTTAAADNARSARLRAADVAVRTVPAAPRGVDLGAVLAELRSTGVESLMVEGGAAVLTSLLGDGLVDRLVVSLSPRIVGTGVEAVGDLGIGRIADGIRLSNRVVYLTEEDVLLGWDVEPTR
jgi:riboflavin-specific deaminase-like protein